MSEQNLSFEKITALLNQHKILADAAEVHGILSGMLAAGMPLENRDWLAALADMLNQGDALNKEVSDSLMQLFNQLCQQLLEAEFSLTLCLPDDAAPINDRGQALIHWVEGFMLGFGLHQADLTKCSDDVKEALDDFAEIVRMDAEMPEDDESERALFEVIEYVRISSMLCFNELGQSVATQQDNATKLH